MGYPRRDVGEWVRRWWDGTSMIEQYSDVVIMNIEISNHIHDVVESWNRRRPGLIMIGRFFLWSPWSRDYVVLCTPYHTCTPRLGSSSAPIRRIPADACDSSLVLPSEYIFKKYANAPYLRSYIEPLNDGQNELRSLSIPANHHYRKLGVRAASPS